MSKKIGIIAAMNEEMAEIKLKMNNIVLREILGLKFFEGQINNKDCVLVECGIGKVNAARTTQIMLDNFEIELKDTLSIIINFSSFKYSSK